MIRKSIILAAVAALAFTSISGVAVAGSQGPTHRRRDRRPPEGQDARLRSTT